MRISARGVSKGSVLPETTVHFRSGAVTLVPVEGGQRPSVLGLILSGRMAPDSGEVTVDGVLDARRVRDAVVLVDAPDISSPADDLPLSAVLREELLFAGARGAVRIAKEVRRMLADDDLVSYRAMSMIELPAAVRVRALARAAVRRPGTEGVVIVSPDRHGGYPLDWYDVARELADTGLAVVVLAGTAAVDAIDAVVPGARDAHEQVHDDVAAERESVEDEDEDGMAAPEAGAAQTRTMAVVRRQDEPSRDAPQGEQAGSDPEPDNVVSEPEEDRPDDDQGSTTVPTAQSQAALLRRHLRGAAMENDEETGR